MKDILSQSEIDSLISALGSGKIEEEESSTGSNEHQSYDFRRPSKFSKEQIRTLQVIHENYARILGNFLTAYLRVPVQIQLVSVSQVTYEEFVFSSGSHTANCFQYERRAGQRHAGDQSFFCVSDY